MHNRQVALQICKYDDQGETSVAGVPAGHSIAPSHDQAEKVSMSPSVKQLLGPRPPLLFESIDTKAVRGAFPAKLHLVSAHCPIEAAVDKERPLSFL